MRVVNKQHARMPLAYQSYVTPSAVAHGGMGQVQLAW